MCCDVIAEAIDQSVMPALTALADEVVMKTGRRGVVQSRRVPEALPWWGVTFTISDGPEWFEDIVLEVSLEHGCIQADIVTDPGGRIWASANAPFYHASTVELGPVRSAGAPPIDEVRRELSERAVRKIVGFIAESGPTVVAIVHDESWRKDPR